MADRRAFSDTADEEGDEDGRGSTTGTPRWVKVFGIIALVLVLLVVVMLLIGGIGGGPGGHGPGRHVPAGGAGGNAPASSVTEDQVPSGGDLGGRTPPAGGQ